MHRRTAALLFLLAFGVAGCGGTTAPTVGLVSDTQIEAPPPTTTGELTAPASTNPPVVTTELALTTAPLVTAVPAPTITAPPPLVLPTVPPTAPKELVAVPDAPVAGCDPSYPGVCIPPGPPDLDCADVSYRRFTVVGADYHRFDADGDGIGCESG